MCGLDYQSKVVPAFMSNYFFYRAAQSRDLVHASEPPEFIKERVGSEDCFAVCL